MASPIPDDEREDPVSVVSLGGVSDFRNRHRFLVRQNKGNRKELPLMKRLPLVAAAGIALAILFEVLPFCFYAHQNFWGPSPEFFFLLTRTGRHMPFRFLVVRTILQTFLKIRRCDFRSGIPPRVCGPPSDRVRPGL